MPHYQQSIFKATSIANLLQEINLKFNVTNIQHRNLTKRLLSYIHLAHWTSRDNWIFYPFPSRARYMMGKTDLLTRWTKWIILCTWYCVRHFFVVECLKSLLVPKRCGQNFKSIIFKLIIENNKLGFEIALRWMSQNLTNEKSMLVQVMMWCRQATGHYLSQCWPRYMPPNSHKTTMSWLQASPGSSNGL